MYLRSLTLRNFRCYEHLEIPSLENLAVFIGENDAGKTVLLDAIEILVDKGQITPRDFRKPVGEISSTTLTVRGLFELTPNDLLPDEYRNDDQLILERNFSLESNGNLVSEVIVGCLVSEDIRVDAFQTLNAPDQKEVLEKYHIVAGANKELRLQQMQELIQQGKIKRIKGNNTLSPSKANHLRSFLPRVERISSKEYQHPENVIRRTFQRIAADIISPINEATNEREDTPELATVRRQIQVKLDEEAERIQPLLSKDHRSLKKVSVQPIIDFTKSVGAASLWLDCGEGEQAFDAFGEGTKRRIWMGLLNWERQTLDERSIRNTIRLYDEPDVNLHYQAQRQLFENILSLADNDKSEVQCFVCTHSVHLIDRAPMRTVHLVRVEEDGKHLLVKMQGPEDSDYTDFYEEIGEAIGLSNTALLYDRAFLVVEGPSEEQSLPIIYRNVYKRSMREDGIRIVNLETCGAWRSVLSVLFKNRLNVVHMLLDQDCTSPNSSAKVNSDTLRTVGCSTSFASEQITYIGTKEYEDAFASNLVFSAILSLVDMEQEITLADIDDLKASSDKFSEELLKQVKQRCKKEHRIHLNKPSMATAVAKQCTEMSDVPSELIKALEGVRKLAGLSATTS